MILTQKLYLIGLDWDDPIPTTHVTKWRSWLVKLPELPEIGIPKCIQLMKKSVLKSELQTFCDASEDVFAAVVYLRS